jgi:hypothetical protein
MVDVSALAEGWVTVEVRAAVFAEGARLRLRRFIDDERGLNFLCGASFTFEAALEGMPPMAVFCWAVADSDGGVD